MSTVIATTLTYHDSQANSHKFYRTYVVDDLAIFQWGRVGAVGQWNGVRDRTPSGARMTAQLKLDEKISKGYVRESESTFEFDVARLNVADKETLKMLESALLRSGRLASPALAPAPRTPARTPASPAPIPSVPAAGVHEAFTERALAAVSLAVSDSQAAMVELALLREQWELLEQQHTRAASYLETLDRMLLASV